MYLLNTTGMTLCRRADKNAQEINHPGLFEVMRINRRLAGKYGMSHPRREFPQRG